MLIAANIKRVLHIEELVHFILLRRHVGETSTLATSLWPRNQNGLLRSIKSGLWMLSPCGTARNRLTAACQAGLIRSINHTVNYDGPNSPLEEKDRLINQVLVMCLKNRSLHGAGNNENMFS